MAHTKIKSNFGCAILFALPFAGVGLFVLFLVMQDVWRVWDASTWVETPARILQADMRTRHGSKGSKTYEIECLYSYEWDGMGYKSKSFSLQNSRDSARSFHETWNRKLRGHKKSGEPLPCYVNPRNPSESVLMREMRWELLGLKAICFIVFGGAGAGLIYLAVAGKRSEGEREKYALMHPDELWLWKREWQDGRIASNTLSKVGFCTAIAVFWNAISAPLFFVVPDELGRGNHLAWIGLIFPLVGIWLAWKAIRYWIIRHKFKQSFFHMATMPGVVGGALSGIIRMPDKLESPEGFQVRLRCVHRVTVSTGGKRRTEERIGWEETVAYKKDLLDGKDGGIAVPVLFAIPYDQPSSDESDPDHIIEWRLHVESDVPGVDYEAEFEVPVFKTAGSSPTFTLPEDAIKKLAPLQPKEDLEKNLKDAGIDMEALLGGVTLWRFNRCRNPSFAFAMGVTALVIGGIGTILYLNNIPFIFVAGCALASALFLSATADMVFYSSEITFAKSEIKIVSGNWRLSETVLPAGKLSRLLLEEDAFMGNTRLYSLKIETSDGKKHALARFVSERALLARIAANLATIFPSLKVPNS